MKHIALILALSLAALAQQPFPPRLFVQLRIREGRSTSTDVADRIVERSPNAVAITSLLEAAQYQLMLSPGRSVLFNKAGDPVTTFKAH
jgi:hypothetical protein